MLKITKGLKPFINNEISTYTDAEGNQYVRVKTEDEDFCIAAHDYIEGNHRAVLPERYTWEDAMDSLEAHGLNTFTKEQFMLYIEYQDKIKDKFKEIGGEVLFDTLWYWSSTESDPDKAWIYAGDKDNTRLILSPKDDLYCVRAIINL